MEINKAVLLVAGEGNRLRPITSTLPKPIIPLAGKPLLEHAILGLKHAGIQNILLIIGYKKESIKDHFDKVSKTLEIDFEYTIQKEYLGTAHAARLAKDFVQNDPFLLMYGDLLVDPQIFKEIIQEYEKNDVKGLISLKEVDNPQAFGIITLNSEKKVVKITEKPAPELNVGNLANAGIYIFDPLIFKAIEKTKKSVRGEYEFTDSMEILIKEFSGEILGYVIKNKFWSDIGLPWQLLEANEYILKNLKEEHHGTIESNVSITGNVYIGKGTTIKAGTTIQGPCYIGSNCLIGPNAFIRPNTSIGDNCHIGMSEVKNSIIFSHTNIPHFNYVGDSIICDHVNLGAGTKISNLRFDNKSIKMTIKGTVMDSGRRKLGAIIGSRVQTGINASIMCGKKIGVNSIIGAHTLVVEDLPPNSLCYNDPKEGLIIKKNPFI
ncbi:MAG: bifunctional sugar-1-phosphate nucleotidylyltransferase/acetyltransferase [Promethearchaeota archaeon]